MEEYQMKNNFWRKTAAGISALLLTAAFSPALSAFAAAPDFGAPAEMPSAPFGTASAYSPYFAKPCNERLAMLPEALMKLTPDGYSWEYSYVADKPEWALTLMDYANIYSFIHSNDLDTATVRAILADKDSMVHRKAFTEEELDLLLGDDEEAAMKAFAAPSTIVIGKKGYSARWMYCHTAADYEAAGITPEMVEAVLPYYYNPLFVQSAADAFSQKLFDYTGKLSQTKWEQWDAGDVDLDGTIDEKDTQALKDFLDSGSGLSFRQWASADMDGDSDVDADDLAALEGKIAAGITDDQVMLDVIEYCQYPDYPTGCESVSLYMLLDYYGVNVRVDDIYDLLPMGAQPYDDANGVRHGANPEREFVGNPRSEYSYGVFNDPIAGVAEQFKPGVKTERGASIDKIKAILDTGNPVLAWYVSAPMRDIMYRWSWVDEENVLVHWPGGEHAVVICGYDDTSLTYRDPNAGTTVCIDYATFEKSFTELGGRIVYYENETKTENVTYRGADGSSAGTEATVLSGSEKALSEGWYVVSGDVTIDSAVALSGDVSLILEDGCKLTINGGIAGDGTLTVYGQEKSSGVMEVTSDVTAIAAAGYTQYGGKTVLVSDAEFALSGRDSVSILGGQFETGSGITSDGALTLGCTDEADYIQAGKYQAEKFAVASGDVLYIPDFPKDLSLTGVTGSLRLTYNGESQTPKKEDFVGKLSFEAPLYRSGAFLPAERMSLADNRKLAPYTGKVSQFEFALTTPLGEDDFDLGKVEAGKDATLPGNGIPAKPYSVEIVGKGEYSGSTQHGWYVDPADVSEDITVTAESPLAYDGQPVGTEDFDIKASSALAQGFIDEIAAGKAYTEIGVYSTAPLTGDDVTNVCEPGKALAPGNIYDLSELGKYSMMIVAPGNGRSGGTYDLIGNGIYVMKDGERRSGCFEIDKDGALCFYKANAVGEDELVKIEGEKYQYWSIKADDNEVLPMVTISSGFVQAQRSDGTEPGDYIARILIAENENGNYSYVMKVAAFTVENDESGQVAPDATLLAWADNDYQQKNGVSAAASVAEKKDGKLTIDLTSADGKKLDTYVIDTADGTGTDSSGAAVELPQTGNNSPRDVLIGCAGFLSALAGAVFVGKSGVSRRRRED